MYVHAVSIGIDRKMYVSCNLIYCCGKSKYKSTLGKAVSAKTKIN